MRRDPWNARCKAEDAASSNAGGTADRTVRAPKTSGTGCPREYANAAVGRKADGGGRHLGATRIVRRHRAAELASKLDTASNQ
jgi:hypothetical protein